MAITVGCPSRAQDARPVHLIPCAIFHAAEAFTWVAGSGVASGFFPLSCVPGLSLRDVQRLAGLRIARELEPLPHPARIGAHLPGLLSRAMSAVRTASTNSVGSMI
jgi:hypothetical protein